MLKNKEAFATRLVQSRADIYAVQKLLGHKSLEMTSRYAHHDVESLRKVIDIGVNGVNGNDHPTDNHT